MSNGINGAELLIKALKQEGVDTVFGYPGGAVIPIFDVLFDEPDIRVILTRHEQAAVHAADGYARSTGRPGVCIVTSGPGATNTATGIATANFDSVPLVCISGQVPRSMIGNDAFQEADTVGITRPITKHNYLITDREEMGSILKKTFYIATSGRPGPVVVDIPKDILNAVGSADYPESITIRGYHPNTRGHLLQIRKAAEALKEAQRPLFFIGGGMHISEATEIFREVQSQTHIPVVSSLMGLGILPRSNESFLGMIGMHGTYAANMAVQHCDVMFAVGVRFDDRATGELAKFAPEARIIHVDIDPAAIARNVDVHIPVVGDARDALVKLKPLLPEKALGVDDWREQISAWQKNYPVTLSTNGNRLNPREVIERINTVFPDAIVTSEVGQNQMWAALFYAFKRPRTWLTSGGLGTMGYGFPAALGAQAGNPGSRVIDIAGDGSIQMNIQELATAVIEELPVVIAIFNNGYLGMVRQWQEMFYDRRYSSTCLMRNKSCPQACTFPKDDCPRYTPDFLLLAQAYGAEGLRATTLDEVDNALETAAGITDRPIVIDFIVEREANVWPMVPPGAGIGDMILEGGVTP
jgi:acetolactate synthase I/II/III large subunit